MSDQPALPPPNSPRHPSAADSSPRKTGFPFWLILLLLAGLCLLLLCGGIFAMIAIPSIHKSRMAANEVATISQLKMVAVAQAQFAKRNDYYAASAMHLFRDASLVPQSCADSFEPWQANADQGTTPYQGYLNRMLLGEAGQVRGWVTGSTAQGAPMLSSWAATARPTEPGASGEDQFFIAEAGIVYRKDGADAKTYLLDSAPPLDNMQGWQPAR